MVINNSLSSVFFPLHPSPLLFPSITSVSSVFISLVLFDIWRDWRVREVLVTCTGWHSLEMLELWIQVLPPQWPCLFTATFTLYSIIASYILLIWFRDRDLGPFHSEGQSLTCPRTQKWIPVEVLYFIREAQRPLRWSGDLELSIKYSLPLLQTWDPKLWVELAYYPEIKQEKNQLIENSHFLHLKQKALPYNRTSQ